MTNAPTCGPASLYAELTTTDKLTAAIGIVQAHILASDSNFVPEKMFGVFNFRSDGLEHAQRLLCEVLQEIEEG